jgi:hypothetical protein
MKSLLVAVWCFLTLTALGQAPGTKTPSVQMAPVGKVQLKAGGTATLDLDFRVGEGFHINSNKPKSELLVPTSLKLIPAQQVAVTEIKYPAGKDETFPFAPKEPLNVYSGDFSVTAVLKAAPGTPPGTYPVSGELKYQACDRSACYPPKSTAIQFQVAVVK